MLVPYPALCIIVLNYTTLISLYVAGQTMPYKTSELNRLELTNEFLMLIINYHLMCLTGFVSDPDARVYIGQSIIAFTSLYLGINVGIGLKETIKPVFFKIKYFCIRRRDM